MADNTDTSSYGSYSQIPSGMDVINGRNAMNQNRLFQQEFQARKAMGNIFQQAGGDPDKAENLALQDPSTAYLAPTIAKQMADYKQAQANSQIATMGANQKGHELLAGHLGDYIANGDFSDKSLSGLAATVLSNPDIRNTVGAGKIVDELTNASAIPYQDGVPPMQQPRFQYMNKLRGGAIASAGHFQDVIGKMQMVDTGGQVQPTQVSDVMGTATPSGAPIAKTLPPTTPTYNQNTRQPVYLGGAAPAQGGGTESVPGGQGGAPGTVPAGPALGAEAAANVTGTGSAGQGMALQSRADQVPASKALLGNLEGALNNFTSGPGADWKRVAAATANANSPFGDIFDPKKIASQEEFAKQGFQLAQQQFQALGGTGTDSKLDSTMHTSPNELLSKLGNKGIIHLLKGNEDAIAAKNAEWQQFQQKPGNGPESYGKFSQEFNEHFDPRVFQFQYMDKSEKADSLKGMTTGEVDSFKNKVRYAMNKGWVKAPGQAAQPAQGAPGGQ